MTAWYLDSSAIVKLSVREGESEAMRVWFAEALPSAALVTSELAITEVLRAVTTMDGDAELALDYLDLLDHLEVDRTLLLDAARLGGPGLCSLDAIHLAAALSVRDELQAVVTYDDRMASAAAALGLAVESPGSP